MFTTRYVFLRLIYCVPSTTLGDWDDHEALFELRHISETINPRFNALTPNGINAFLSDFAFTGPEPELGLEHIRGVIPYSGVTKVNSHPKIYAPPKKPGKWLMA
jgi:hypothetical protein